MKATSVSTQQGGLHLTVHPGDNKILIAMSLDERLVDEQSQNLAGFAIFARVAGKAEVAIPNRISFSVSVSPATTAQTPDTMT